MTQNNQNLTPEQVNETVALFQKVKDGVRDANPNQGYGFAGKRPPQGDHECIVLDVTWAKAQFKRKDGASVDGVRVTFDYQLLTDPENPSSPLVFKGESMMLVDKSLLQDDKDQTRCRIAYERFAGHLYTLLGRKTSAETLAHDLLQVKQQLGTNSRVVALVSCRYRPNPKNPDVKYFEEFLLKRISP